LLVTNILRSTPGELMIFIGPKLVFGVWVPYQSRDIWGKVLLYTRHGYNAWQ
jgi:hypothetical protein